MQFLAASDMQLLDKRQMHFREILYLPAQEDTRRISGGDTTEYATAIGAQYTEDAERATRRR